jgi:hypothetical protein
MVGLVNLSDGAPSMPTRPFDNCDGSPVSRSCSCWTRSDAQQLQNARKRQDVWSGVGEHRRRCWEAIGKLLNQSVSISGREQRFGSNT